MRRSDARVLVGRCVRPPVRVSDAGRSGDEVEVFQRRPRGSPLRGPVRRESSYSAWSRSVRACVEELAGLCRGERMEAPGLVQS